MARNSNLLYIRASSSFWLLRQKMKAKVGKGNGGDLNLKNLKLKTRSFYRDLLQNLPTDHKHFSGALINMSVLQLPLRERIKIEEWVDDPPGEVKNNQENLTLDSQEKGETWTRVFNWYKLADDCEIFLLPGFLPIEESLMKDFIEKWLFGQAWSFQIPRDD